MASMLGAIPLPYVIGIVSALGLPGLVLILWYVDNRRTNEILRQYKADMDTVRSMYESNVRLVEKYEKLANELTTIIRLNTQAISQLSERIDNNYFCPLVREKGPQRERTG